MNWSEVIRKCQQNQTKAQKQIYEFFGPKVKGMLRRYTQSEADLQDLLQETFVTVFTKIHQLQNPAALESWIKRIAVTTTIAHFRKSPIFQELNFDITEQGVEIGAFPITAQEAMALVQQLPAGYRLVFNLYVIEGYRHKEISQLLSISEATSRSQLHKAKQALRQMAKLNTINSSKYE